MDNTEILHATNFGKVIDCSCCNEMQLSFGNVLIQMPMQGFDNLSQVLTKMTTSKSYKEIVESGIGRLVINTPHRGLSITVSPKEFEQLTELIDTAVYMKQVKEMVYRDSELD